MCEIQLEYEYIDDEEREIIESINPGRMDSLES